MKALYFSAALAGLLLAVTGCSKDHSIKDIAGKGGPAALRVSMTYDGTAIEQGRVRLRFNATTPPANPLSWDDSADVVSLPSTAGQALFPSLYKGTYYVEGTGYLPGSTFKEPKIVKGGFVYMLTQNTAVNIVLPLTTVVVE